ncbi:response regulator transcription factor [Qipengyuania oceanensis]|uniref:DNA-binding response regulator n=1 Tax=Qipengyuania oceanensis TaxID=1463597 RepID=A0A844YFX2_9SPHN|nr:response regulator transcription factor [Qipengyuania oceanensis]MXO62533.1 DNA-binding response regulator [Qipengyuania oceanensis]
MVPEINLVSPCEFTREGFARILSSEGFTVRGCFDSIAEVRYENLSKNSIFLLDDPDSAEHARLVETVKAEFESAVVVLLSADFDLASMLKCFRAGARGYVIKSLKAAPMIAAIRLAISGQRVLPQDVLEIFENQAKPIPALPEIATELDDANLSPRENDVLCCLMAGYSNKVIARELDVCEATVKVHVKAILRKLNVNNRTQAAIWANSHSTIGGYYPIQSSQSDTSAQPLVARAG